MGMTDSFIVIRGNSLHSFARSWGDSDANTLLAFSPLTDHGESCSIEFSDRFGVNGIETSK